ncbi:transposable element Tcb2 transposase [Trichonephila clavipes]|nr:transposable element Tcb2 transposase [Trichonephila clavipes]
MVADVSKYWTPDGQNQLMRRKINISISTLHSKRNVKLYSLRLASHALTNQKFPLYCILGEMANNQSVRRHLDAFTRGRITGKLEEGRSVTSVAAEFGIAHSIVSTCLEQFQTLGTAIRKFSSGRR